MFKQRSLQLVYYFFLLLGVLPCGFDFQRQRFVASRKILAWKCAMTFTTIVSHRKSVKTIATKLDFTNFHLTTQVLATLEQFSTMLLVVFLTLNQFLNLKRLLNCMKKFFEIRDRLHTIRPLSLSSALKCSLALVCAELFLALGPMFIEIHELELTTHVSFMFAVLNVYYPEIVLIGLNCGFYVGSSSIRCMVEHLNGIVQAQVQYFIQEYRAETLVHKRVLKCCQMSEFCDKASRLHHELMELSQLFREVFNVIILLTINYSIVQMVNQVRGMCKWLEVPFIDFDLLILGLSCSMRIPNSFIVQS
jgi:7tm Chemosensory receptor